MWIKLKKLYGAKGKRVEWHAQWLPFITCEKLCHLRGYVFEEYYRQWPTSIEHVPLGFVPSHVADPVIKQSGIKVDTLDHIMLRLAITQEIMIFDGTWESGPTGEGKRLTSPLPRALYE